MQSSFLNGFLDIPFVARRTLNAKVPSIVLGWDLTLVSLRLTHPCWKLPLIVESLQRPLLTDGGSLQACVRLQFHQSVEVLCSAQCVTVGVVDPRRYHSPWPFTFR